MISFDNIQDKMSIMQVLGCLIQKPSILTEGEYKIETSDFVERFHAIIFGAIYNLAWKGLNTIDVFQIDEYLSNFDKQYIIFQDNDGVDYLSNIIDMAKLENFEYYYRRLRKFSLLRDVARDGQDITEIYDPTELDPNLAEEKIQKFNSMSIDEIITFYETKNLDRRNKYLSDGDNVKEHASKGAKDLKEELKKTPEMGAPMQSKIMNTVARGCRKKKLYMRSAPTGWGKSRDAIGDACTIAIPEIYNSEKKEWEHTGFSEPTLFISTELELNEVRTPMWAYLADVQEEHILDGKYIDDEEERVDKAIRLIEESNFYLVQLPNHSLEEVESIIKEYKIKYNVQYVFFDYIFVSTKMLQEMAKMAKGIKMREDNVLYTFADTLKRLCNKLDVHISTSTQVSGEWEKVENANQNILRGAKSLGDKIDVGYIAMPVTKKDLEALEPILKSRGGFDKIPNRVYHVYKVRRGKLNFIKVWMYSDLGTCRNEDLFVTKNDYTLIDVKPTEIYGDEQIVKIWDETEIHIADSDVTADSEMFW